MKTHRNRTGQTEGTSAPQCQTVTRLFTLAANGDANAIPFLDTTDPTVINDVNICIAHDRSCRTVVMCVIVGPSAYRVFGDGLRKPDVQWKTRGTVGSVCTRRTTLLFGNGICRIEIAFRY